MILADKFTCDVPVEGSIFLECSLPGAGALEWITGLGTLLSALAAIGLTIFTVWHSKKTATREKELESRSALEKEAEILIAAAPKPLSDLSEIDNIGASAVIWRNAAERYNRAVQVDGAEGVLIGDMVLRLVTDTSTYLSNKRVLVGSLDDAAVQSAIVSRLNATEQLSENVYLSLLMETVKEDVGTAVLAYARASNEEEKMSARKDLQAAVKKVREANAKRSDRNTQ